MRIQMLPASAISASATSSAAVGDIVHRADQALRDQLADELAGAAFDVEVDGRRRPVLAAVASREPQRLAEIMAASIMARCSDQNVFALRLEPDRRRLLPIVEQAHAADRRGRQDRAAAAASPCSRCRG